MMSLNCSCDLGVLDGDLLPLGLLELEAVLDDAGSAGRAARRASSVGRAACFGLVEVVGLGLLQLGQRDGVVVDDADDPVDHRLVESVEPRRPADGRRGMSGSRRLLPGPAPRRGAGGCGLLLPTSGHPATESSSRRARQRASSGRGRAARAGGAHHGEPARSRAVASRTAGHAPVGIARLQRELLRT